MRRTIIVKFNIDTGRFDVSYRKKKLGYLSNFTRTHFGFETGIYTVTIKESVKGIYSFDAGGFHCYYSILVNKKDDCELVGLICRKEFSDLFFTPDPAKKYNVTIKKK